MFITELLIRALNWKQLKCLLTAEWIHQVGHIHTTEWYTTIRMNQSTCSIKNLINNLNERRSTLKSTNCMLNLYKSQRSAKAINAVRCQHNVYS